MNARARIIRARTMLQNVYRELPPLKTGAREHLAEALDVLDTLLQNVKYVLDLPAVER